MIFFFVLALLIVLQHFFDFFSKIYFIFLFIYFMIVRGLQTRQPCKVSLDWTSRVTMGSVRVERRLSKENPLSFFAISNLISKFRFTKIKLFQRIRYRSIFVILAFYLINSRFSSEINAMKECQQF